MFNGIVMVCCNCSKVVCVMDIWIVIGVLFGFYGIILMIIGLVKGFDVYVDLVFGMCLFVVGVVFFVWVRFCLVKVLEVVEEVSELVVGRG